MDRLTHILKAMTKETAILRPVASDYGEKFGANPVEFELYGELEGNTFTVLHAPHKLLQQIILWKVNQVPLSLRIGGQDHPVTSIVRSMGTVTIKI